MGSDVRLKDVGFSTPSGELKLFWWWELLLSKPKLGSQSKLFTGLFGFVVEEDSIIHSFEVAEMFLFVYYCPTISILRFDWNENCCG